MTLRSGFIGLGNIGKPMARCWVDAGFPCAIFDVAPEPLEEVGAAGAVVVASPREVAENAEVIGICVRDDDDVRAVLLGEDGVLAGASEGTLVMIHSTVQPGTVVAMAQAGAERGVSVVDVAITGGEARAATGDLATMVGGDAASVEKAKPLFDVFSKAGVFPCGELGDGMRVKLCINVVTYLQFSAGLEGLKLAKGCGLDLQTFIDVGRANGQITPLMERFLIIHQLSDEDRASEGMQSVVRPQKIVAEKDLAWALKLARENGVSLPGAALVSQLMGAVYGVEDPK